MDITKPPQWLVDAAPEGAKGFLGGWGWWVILLVLAFLAVVLLWTFGTKLLGSFFGLFRGGKKPAKKADLAEHLADYPPLPPSTGDRRLAVEGVPVRLRLVVAAPAGVATKINAESINKLLDGVLTGLGDIAAHDHPRIMVWPAQLSYEGFIHTFNQNMIIPEEDGEPSRWVTLAGQARIGKHQVNLGLAMQSIKPNTIGRRRLKTHEWDSVLRVRVRD